MANRTHVRLLKKSVAEWNARRLENPKETPSLYDSRLTHIDLTGAKLDNANLRKADLSSSDLHEADLSHARLRGVVAEETRFDRINGRWADFGMGRLRGATFTHADLRNVDLTDCDLTDANLQKANLAGAKLHRTTLTGADLRGATLNFANLVQAELSRARLSNARVYGVSAWGLRGLETAEQEDLIITPFNESVVTIDNIELAQFLDVMQRSERLRGVIDTVTAKVVLIIGRFTAERKAVLNELRATLRKEPFDVIPVVFDFDKAHSRDTMETIRLLAGMARFLIADLSDARSVLMELQAIVPDYPSLPIRPLILRDQRQPGMLDSFRRYPWFLDLFAYTDTAHLLGSLDEVLAPAEQYAQNVRTR
ncbi:MAG: pentapeptide repeat-containing protein [Myxococcota bacterium]